MGRRHLLYLLYTSSARPLTPLPPPPFLFHKGYSHESSNENHVADETINHERAPSTLEEFERLQEEKASEGVASQKVEKVKDGVVEAATGEGGFESVKESFKKASGVDNTKAADFQSTK